MSEERGTRTRSYDVRHLLMAADLLSEADLLLEPIRGTISSQIPAPTVICMNVLDILALDDDAVRIAAADALETGAPEWKRRLLAWRLRGDDVPYRRKRRGRRPDVELGQRFFSLRRRLSYAETIAELSPHDEPDDRNLQRKVARVRQEAWRELEEHFKLLDAAVRVIEGE